MSSADSALSIEHSGMAIMERIQRARERRSKITSEEMKTVIEERDNALTRVGIGITVNLDITLQSGSALTHFDSQDFTHTCHVPGLKPLHHRRSNTFI